VSEYGCRFSVVAGTPNTGRTGFCNFLGSARRLAVVLKSMRIYPFHFFGVRHMGKSTSPIALFMNGAYKSNLDEIVKSQAKFSGSRHYYIQPYSKGQIVLLAKSAPTPENPITLYLSLTDSLHLVSYRAKIVGWRNKRELAKDEALLKSLNEHIEHYQHSEKKIFMESSPGKECVNLVSVVDVEPLVSQFSVSCLHKTSDGTPLKPRTRSGNWSPVFELPSWLGTLPEVVRETADAELQAGIAKSLNDSASARKQRLAIASKLPEVSQVVSRAYRRNVDVIAEVLHQAKGICEECHKPAPFNRASDGEPFLEVHHRIMLSKGGEDTVANALALCPNCHRKLHFG
jgi:5-methylcytosine-specific restriction protein A